MFENFKIKENNSEQETHKMTRDEQIKKAASEHYFRMSQGVDYHLAPEREAGFHEGAKWADENRPVNLRSDVSVYGTDGCKNCETGRITLYARERWCLECLAQKKDSN